MKFQRSWTSKADLMHSMSEEDLQKYGLLISSHLSSYSLDSLRCATAAWTKWAEWSQAQTPPRALMPVDPVVLSSFFQDTVTKAKMRNKNVTGHNTELRLRNDLNFMCAHLGFNFQPEHKELTHTADGAKQSTAKVHGLVERHVRDSRRLC